MRNHRPKPKRRVSVPLPAELRDFLISVLDKINREVAEAMTESDDLLQTEFVYGGRIEEGGDVWGFTYFPSAAREEKWELDFTRVQLAEIAAGRRSGVDLFECVDPQCGNKFSTEIESCFKCDWE